MKKLSILNSQFSTSKGFTLIELLLSITIFAILVSIITLNLNTAQQNTNIQTTVETLLTDLNQQQIKAMVGDTEGRGALDNYGVHFNTTDYTLFHGTYLDSESTNFLIDLSDNFQISTTFPNSAVIFAKGSGEIVGYGASTDTITVTDTVNGEQKVIEINNLGVVTSVQ